MSVHIIRKKQSDGTIKEYHYAYRGGPPLLEKPGTAAYKLECREKCKTPPGEDPGTVAGLIEAYKRSAKFDRLSEPTRKSYELYFGYINEEFGDAPLKLFEDARMRGRISDWRDTMKDRPRTADYAVATLKRILSYAMYDRGTINTNVAVGIEPLHSGNRADIVWSEDELEWLYANCTPQLKRAVELARHTGLRRGDFTRILKSADKGSHLEWVVSKTRSRVYIPVTPELRDVLDSGQPQGCMTILASTHGTPWTPMGFSASFRRARQRMNKARVRAGLEPVNKRVHDLRGTAVTRFVMAGLDDRAIATITGWTEKSVSAIRQRYVSKDAIMLAAVEKLTPKGSDGKSKREQFTPPV